jgi:hypothetical protein
VRIERRGFNTLVLEALDVCEDTRCFDLVHVSSAARLASNQFILYPLVRVKSANVDRDPAPGSSQFQDYYLKK